MFSRKSRLNSSLLAGVCVAGDMLGWGDMLGCGDMCAWDKGEGAMCGDGGTM